MKKISIFLLLITFLAGCENEFFEEVPKNDPEALFETLWTTFKTDYGPFEARGVDWEEQYNRFRPMVNSNTSDEELYSVVSQMLRTLNDGHVDLITPGRKIFNSNIYFDQQKEDSLFNLDLIKSGYLEPGFKENGFGGNTFGKIGNIGYWHIAWISDNFIDIDEILNSLSDVDGLIIDMRNNGGGDFTYAYSNFGRFTSEERYVHRSKTKNGKGANDYTDWYEWDIKPSGKYFDKPLVLLTDRYTISAGERTVMAFKTLPNLIHLGDSTNGAHSTKIGKELANGWYFTVAPQIIEFNDGKTYEGTGMIPDIYAKNKIEQLDAGQDVTLETALSLF